jgi:hypothetical protein
MADSCILFFDDLLIATNGSLDEHLKIVDEVLKRIIIAGLKLRPKKLNIAKEHVEFLGMVFQKGHISIPDAKIEAFRKLPSPNTPKKVKSLICALSFYRNFVPDFAGLSREIMELSNVNIKQFKWTPDHETKLRKLINSVCENSKLYLPDPTKRFYVQTDSSTNCGGGRVFQKDDEGNEKLIAAVSRTYTKTERGYSIFKKEILALLYTLKSMDYFLRFADQLTILVDAKSIIYLRLAKDSSGILLRFSIELSKYDAEICHVSGEDNIISDVLSRHHSDIKDIIEENLTNKPLTEKETLKIIKQFTIPNEFTLSPKELKHLLEGPSPTHSTKTSTKKSKAITGKRKIKNTPATLTNKKLNLPQLSMRRPGVLLPKKNKNNKNKTQNSTKKTLIDNNVLTRKMVQPSNIEPQIEVTNLVNSENEIQSTSTTNKVIKKGRNKKPNKTNDNGLNLNEKQENNETNNPQEDIDLFMDLDIEESNDSKNKTISYNDIENITNIIHNGVISINDFITAQKQDEFCIKARNDANEKPNQTMFEVIQDVLFKINKTTKKPVLPEKLIDVIINVKHFSIFGAHSTPSRISRDIKNEFFVPKNFLFKKLKDLIDTCYICQIYNDNIKGHMVSSLPKPNKPRLSWSIDIISNMPKTENENCQILLCVDDFCGYVICVPLKNSSSKSIIEALKAHIFMPFGIPQNIRCDEQSSFYNSTEFFDFMTNYGIKLNPTSVAAPYSNSRAESAIKNIKKLARKFLFQEHCLEKWDDYLYILTASHNSSIGIYGFSSEQIMFANKLPHKANILSFDWVMKNEDETIEKLFEKAEIIRTEAIERMNTKSEQNRTYKNSSRIFKQFKVGSLVLHRQMQVSTGKGSDYKPKFTGPYIITSLNEDECTAFLEHIHNKTIIKLHFSNLQLLHYNPELQKYSHSIPQKLVYDLHPENI